MKKAEIGKHVEDAVSSQQVSDNESETIPRDLEGGSRALNEDWFLKAF